MCRLSRNLGATTPEEIRSCPDLCRVALPLLPEVTVLLDVVCCCLTEVSQPVGPHVTILTVPHANLIPEHACLLVYDLASIGNRVPTFRPRALTLPAGAHCPLVQIVFQNSIPKCSLISVIFVESLRESRFHNICNNVSDSDLSPSNKEKLPVCYYAALKVGLRHRDDGVRGQPHSLSPSRFGLKILHQILMCFRTGYYNNCTGPRVDPRLSPRLL